MSAAEDFDQIRMQLIDPLQYAYELIRPIVLFGETAAERSRQTGIDRTVIGDKAQRFVTDGMSALADGRTQPASDEGSIYPEAIAGYIVYLKQLYPPIHLREIERILARKFGYQTNHHTLKRFLEPYETPLQLELDLTTFSSFADAYEARWTVVRMAQEGWDKKSIAACLKLSRSHVYNILDAFDKQGFEGLEDHRTRPPHHPDNQLNLPFLKTVLDLLSIAVEISSKSPDENAPVSYTASDLNRAPSPPLIAPVFTLNQPSSSDALTRPSALGSHRCPGTSRIAVFL